MQDDFRVLLWARLSPLRSVRPTPPYPLSFSFLHPPAADLDSVEVPLPATPDPSRANEKFGDLHLFPSGWRLLCPRRAANRYRYEK